MRTELEVKERLQIVKDALAFGRVLFVDMRGLEACGKVLEWVLGADLPSIEEIEPQLQDSGDSKQ